MNEATGDVLRIREEVAWADGGDRTTVLVLDDPSPQPVALEGPAHVIWTLLHETPSAIDVLVERVAEAYGESVEAIRADVQGFVADLIERRLVQVA